MSWPPHHRQTVPELELDGTLPGKSGPHTLRPVLVVLNGGQIGERARLDASPVEIGRDPRSALVLRDAGVAWQHARIEPGSDGWTVIAVDPETPVEVEGMRVSRILLSPDDRIQIGSVVVRFELHGPVEQAFDAAVEERLSRDELTGLLSRRKFELEVSARLEGAAQRDETLGLMVLDLDRLKDINDRHGHLLGARVIAAAGQAIAASLPEGAFACRLGGDEFAVAAPGAAIDATEQLAQQLVDAIGAARVPHQEEQLHVQASAGVAVGPEQGAAIFSLLREADDALLRAKREGGGCVRR